MLRQATAPSDTGAAPLLQGDVEGVALFVLFLLVLTLACAAVTGFFAYRDLRDRAWTAALKDVGATLLFLGIGVGGLWFGTRWIDRGWQIARQAIPEYCPQIQRQIEAGQPPREAGAQAVATMRRVEKSIRTLDRDELVEETLRTCHERTGWDPYLDWQEPRDDTEGTRDDTGRVRPSPVTPSLPGASGGGSP